MRLRMVKVDEIQFLNCVQHGLWGSNRPRFGKWQKGDQLAFVVGSDLAGLATVTGTPYLDDAVIWDNGLFPERIPIEFSHVLSVDRRPSLKGKIGETLAAATKTSSYGIYLLNQSILSEALAKLVQEAIISRKNDINLIKSSLTKHIQKARQMTK